MIKNTNNKKGKTACFLIGVTGKEWTKTGNAYIGSVSDDPYDIRTFLKKVHYKNDVDHIGTELISTTEHTLSERGYFARPGETTRGLNSSGLGFTCALVEDDKTFDKPKNLPAYADITEQMMKTCSSVENAIALFHSFGATYPAYSVLLADVEGNLAHLEVGSFGISVLNRYSKKEPGCVMAVNCYRTPKFVQYNDPISQLENRENNNAARLERGQELAKMFKGDFDVAKIAEVLSDHANSERDPIKNPVLPAWGYSICNHGTRGEDEYRFENLPWGTVSSEIMDPYNKDFWYAYGWPCGSKPKHKDQLFQEYSWGRYLPFRATDESGELETVTLLSTIDGKLTPDGVKNLSLV